MANIGNRVRILEKVFTPQTDDGPHIKVAFGMNSVEWFMLNKNGQLMPVGDKHPSNVLYVSEEGTIL